MSINRFAGIRLYRQIERRQVVADQHADGPERTGQDLLESGKTRLINHFIIDEQWFLVDLPGYGYAKLSKTERERLRKMIEGYLMHRRNLVCTFLLIDSRHEPQKADTAFMEWLAAHDRPFILLFTKTDKLSNNQLANNIALYRKELSAQWEEMPLLLLTSAETKRGREELLSVIGEMIHAGGAAKE